jgi:hypothetical protein
VKECLAFPLYLSLSSLLFISDRFPLWFLQNLTHTYATAIIYVLL